MAEYEKKVRLALKEHGCVFVRRGKGDHDIWYSPISNTNIAVDSKIKSRHRGALRKEVLPLAFVIGRND